MDTNLFKDKSFKPDDKSLAAVLGETGMFWQAIKKHFQDEYGDVKEEWKFYYQKYGWILSVHIYVKHSSVSEEPSTLQLAPLWFYFAGISSF